MRRLIAALLTTFLVLGSAGCSVAENGWVGVGRAANGQLSVYLRTCDRPFSRVDLRWVDSPGNGDSPEALYASWSLNSTRDTTISWPLVGSGTSKVVATKPLRGLPSRGKILSLLGGTADGNGAARGAEFSVPDLEGLAAGSILIPNPDVKAAPGNPTTSTVNAAQFAALDCTQFQ